MNRWQLVASCITLGGLALAAAGQDRDPNGVPKYEARTFYETTTYFGASFSADEKRLLITSDASGVFNAYSVAVEGGEPWRSPSRRPMRSSPSAISRTTTPSCTPRTRAATNSTTSTSPRPTARSAT
jgi:hypothetical protein